jgi:hypothetical protein
MEEYDDDDVVSYRLGRRRPQVDDGKRRRAEMDGIYEYIE